MNLAIELVVKSSLLLLGAGGIAWLMKNASAAVRHRLWALAFLGLAVLPLLVVRLPRVEVERPALRDYGYVNKAKSLAGVAVGTPENAAVTAPVTADLPPAVQGRPIALPNDASSFPFADGLLDLWAIGALIVLAQAGVMLMAAAALARRGTDLASDPRLGVPPHTRVIRTANVDVPMTFGLYRPTILLPESSAEWTDERLQTVLLHEAAHIRRADWAWLVFARFVCAAYWFNPLAWWAGSRLRAESESAADDTVLRTGISAPQYAEMLVELAAAIRDRRLGVTALPFIEKASLKARVAEILRTAKRRGPLTRRAATTALVLGAATVLPFAATHLVAGPEVAEAGTIDLGGGRQATLFAITEMSGDVARSWDMRGALLPEPLRIDSQGRSFLQDVASSQNPSRIVRYAIFRSDDDGGLFPTLSNSPNGSPLTAWPMNGVEMGSNYYSFRDAAGRRFRAVRIEAVPGATTAKLYAKVTRGDWKCVAYRQYVKGEMRGMFNPTYEVRVDPTIPKPGMRSKVSFTLPEKATDKMTMVRIAPGEDRHYFEGTSGGQEAYSDVAAEAIQWVSIFERPFVSVVLEDIPLEPKGGMAYEPDHFSPEGLITAQNGMVKLPDGAGFQFEGVWDTNSQVRGKDVWRKASISPKEIDAASRAVSVWFRRTPDNIFSPSEVFGSDGRQLLGNSSSSVQFPDGNHWGFSVIVPKSMRTQDLMMRVPVGKYRTIGAGDLGGTNGYVWNSEPVHSGPNALKITFPKAVADQLHDQDVSMVLIDSEGHDIGRRRTDMRYEWSENWVKFHFDNWGFGVPFRLEIRVRPYRWIKFPNVSLAEK